MSLWADYFKIREGFETLEDARGFATYQFHPEHCYIRDLYVHPDFRKQGHASLLAYQIECFAKARGLKKILGSVAFLDPNVTENIQILIAYGMKLLGLSNDGKLLFFEKVLE